jgi:hypothetical protein
MGGSCGVIPNTPRQPGVMGMTLFSSPLLNIMSCHLFCICDTLFNVYDPPIDTVLSPHPRKSATGSINLIIHQSLSEREIIQSGAKQV